MFKSKQNDTTEATLIATLPWHYENLEHPAFMRCYAYEFPQSIQTEMAEIQREYESDYLTTLGEI